MSAPNAQKVRKTKTRLDWFWDPTRKVWRFLASDLTHRAEYERLDAAGEPLQPARPHENKGWVPAAQAIQYDEEARKSLPKELKHLAPEPAKAS